MIPYLKKSSWSPYLCGAGIGILSWITFYFMGKALGISTTFVRAIAFITGLFSVEHVFTTPYLAKYAQFKPIFEWQFALVIGVFIGALFSTKLSGITFAPVPYLWGQNFGFSKIVRFVGAGLGGFLFLFGARLAGGCTSGHGISGGLQLATTSWLFLITIFASGVLAAHIIYKKSR